MLRFLNAFIAESSNYVDTADEKVASNLTLSLAETIYRPEGALPGPRGNLTARETFFRQLFFDFGEVFSAYQTLVDFRAFSIAKPSRRSPLSAARLITFWREAYFNELYIFLCRLEVYAKRVARPYRHDSRINKVPLFVRHIQSLIDSRFGDLKTMRSTHVHTRRYEHTDAELKRIQLLETLAVHGKMKEMKGLYSTAVRRGRRQNRENFRRISLEAKDVLKGVFDSFERFMLSSANELIYPPNLRDSFRSKRR